MGVRIVKLPDIGEGMAEAELVEWHVKVGDLVAEDQPLADVMTDKATIEIPSPAAGTVLSLGGERGQTMAIGSELLRLDVGGEADAPAAVALADGEVEGSGVGASFETPAPQAPPDDEGGGASRRRHAEERPKVASRSTQDGASFETPALRPPQDDAGGGTFHRARPPGEKPLASPAVRKRALDAGIDLRRVRGTGPADRITHDDLDAYLSAPEGPAPSVAASRQPNLAIDEVKVIGLRRRIAQRMAEAKRRVAHFSYVEEVDVTALEELRGTLNARFGGSRPKLTLLPFLVAALVRTLPGFPGLNAHYDDEADVVRRFGGVHVGIATQTPNGLTVPVLRHAETRDLWNSAAEIRRLADAARAGTAARDELTGSTITITSLGAIGGIVTTPVMNRPEVAIVGVNKQVLRPVWLGDAKTGTVAPRLMMNLSSSFDHRVVDGHDAALFLQALKALLETPALLLLDP